MNAFFINKEHYLTFKKIWSRAVNSPRAKSYLIPCLPFPNYSWSKTKDHNFDNYAFVRYNGWIRPEHMILYNLLRDKPVDRGFESRRKVNPVYEKDSLDTAIEKIKHIFMCIKAVNDIEVPSRYLWKNDKGELALHDAHRRQFHQDIANFFYPFGDYFERSKYVKLIEFEDKLVYNK